MGKRKRKQSDADPYKLIELIHAQLKKGEPLPLPWDALQTDDPLGHHNLQERLKKSLRIPSIGPSRHRLKVQEDLPPEEFFPDRVWTIQVMPSFNNNGLVAVFEGRTRVRCAIVCKGDIPDQPDAEYVVRDHVFPIESWDDPVLPVIQSLNIAPMPDRSLPDGTFFATCDGIGYTFRIETNDIATSIRFSNPDSGPFRRLERACFKAAKQIARELDDPQVSNFIRSWKSYMEN